MLPAVSRDAAVVQQHDAIDLRRNLVKVVRDDDNVAPGARKLSNTIEIVKAGSEIETSGLLNGI